MVVCHLFLCVFNGLVSLVDGWYMLVCTGVARDLLLTWMDLFRNVIFSMGPLLTLCCTVLISSFCCLVSLSLFAFDIVW